VHDWLEGQNRASPPSPVRMPMKNKFDHSPPLSASLAPEDTFGGSRLASCTEASTIQGLRPSFDSNPVHRIPSLRGDSTSTDRRPNFPVPLDLRWQPPGKGLPPPPGGLSWHIFPQAQSRLRSGGAVSGPMIALAKSSPKVCSKNSASDQTPPHPPPKGKERLPLRRRG
jgi:hypothetical protein